MQGLSGVPIFQVRYCGQKIKGELILLASAYLSGFISPHLDLCILSSSHIEVREVIQNDHIFSLPFSVLLPMGMSFPT